MEISMDEKTTVVVASDKIQRLIYVVRGKQVMMDSDLAMLYRVETGNLNKAMKRNQKRFPEEFCFRLTKEEYEDLKFQIGSSSDGEHGGRRKLPYVYTEQGIAMLSAVLRSDIAIRVSIQIMKTFVELRRYLAHGAFLLEKVNDLETKQIDAFSLMTELIQQAEKNIILIDGYVDVATLNILSKKKNCVDVCIYTLPSARMTAQDINNFNAQYPNLEVKRTTAFHDRFLMIDEEKGYHIGASLKDAGKKCFGINKIEDIGVIKDILQRAKLTS